MEKRADRGENRVGFAAGRASACFGEHVDPAAFAVEKDLAVAQCEEGVVAAHADVAAGLPLGAALADEDVAGDDDFADRKWLKVFWDFAGGSFRIQPEISVISSLVRERRKPLVLW